MLYIPFNHQRINLSDFPSSSANKVNDSPIKVKCSECKNNTVDIHPLVKQGVIPKELAPVFTYIPPPTRTKTKSKLVQKARIVTSQEVKAEVRAVEERKRQKNILKIKLPAKKSQKLLKLVQKVLKTKVSSPKVSGKLIQTANLMTKVNVISQHTVLI